MGINTDEFNSPAKKGDVSGLAISCAIAFGQIADCLEAINNKQEIDPVKIAKIREISLRTQEIFQELTAWTND